MIWLLGVVCFQGLLKRNQDVSAIYLFWEIATVILLKS